METGNLNDRRAIVIGASSGIGAAVARQLARIGYRVGIVARRNAELEQLATELNSHFGAGAVLPFTSDATEYDQIPALFDQIVEQLGGLTLVVYAAGIMPAVKPEEYDFSKDRQMVEVNLLGTMAWLNEAAKFYSRVQSGTIVGVGSIAGDRGRKGNPGYNTSKGAQAIYLESLRNRLAAHNVRVVTIKPGFVQTAMTAGMGNLLWMISADEAAKRIVDAAQKSKGTVYVPRRWRLVSFVIRSIPSFVFRRLDI
jgi:short-subunit dehydrogenase